MLGLFVQGITSGIRLYIYIYIFRAGCLLYRAGLVGWLVNWLVGWLVGRLVGSLISWLACRIPDGVVYWL